MPGNEIILQNDKLQNTAKQVQSTPKFPKKTQINK